MKILNSVTGYAFAVICTVLVASGCSSGDEVETEPLDELQEEITSGGASSDQAACVSEKMADEFGSEQLESTDDLTPEETEALTAIVSECLS